MVEQFYDFEPDFIVIPGETLMETIESKGLSQAELAKRTGRPTKTINGIIKGTISITPDTALQFEKVLGVPASFWNNLEKNYRESLALVKESELLKESEGWLEKFPIKEMKKMGWISSFKNDTDQLREVLKFFGVASVETWEDIWNPKVAFRKSDDSNQGAISAWLRKAELNAESISCSPFDEKMFKEAIIECRELTNEKDPNVFIPKLVEICSKAGVAVVFLQEIPGCKVSGATKWVNSQKALISLSLRYKSNDHLWFTFFHEAAHILLHGKKLTFIEGITDEIYAEKEDEANSFAANTLIPKHFYENLITSKPITKQKVIRFANSINIAPGIVVGRLQRDKVIRYSYFNDLKQFYKWVKN
ncbi:XRE family transcriptional regulator [Fictibacillus phosphorivorans]|uniref:XRE family transcriptional regulator n=1 Tax=Fictibacillus phosphorivorans TaxID=1221500 RepID=A0A161RTE1_9BACL|nr:helix-turn-helix domain-containing protein [Fictibacillus phosphorivorans]KZE64693.1 XRE family transcriptional regulator [Fictibacillus phosphorivorans]